MLPSTSSSELSEDFDDEHDSQSISEHALLYKNWGRSFEESQHARRAEYLLKLKEQRLEQMDAGRDLVDLFNDVDQVDTSNAPHIDEYGQWVWYSKKGLQLKLMMSEWFTDVPDDLEKNWIVKFCPPGQRRLVIAHKGMTKYYNFKSRPSETFKTFLPGGGKGDNHQLTVLDCILNQNKKTFYVLDLLVWSSVVLTNSEATLRNFIMKSKFESEPKTFEKFGSFNYTFKYIDYYEASRSIVQQRMHEPFEYGLDGILFYYKEATYIPGLTPLATWLKPFMLPEKLGIDIPEKYLKHKPKNYVDMEHYLNLHARRRSNRVFQMDNENVQESQENVGMEMS